MRLAVVINNSRIREGEGKGEGLVLDAGVEERQWIAKGTLGHAMAIGLPDPHHGVAHVDVDRGRNELISPLSDIDRHGRCVGLWRSSEGEERYRDRPNEQRE